MRPPCEIVQRDFLPVVRTFVARSLRAEGFTQTEIASKMDMTQAAVSKYLKQPVSKTKLTGELKILSEKLTEMLKTGETSQDQVVKEMCATCMRSRISSVLCEMHQKKVPSLKAANCQVCSGLLGGSDENLAERANVITDMLDALGIIELSNTFESIVPQVRANFVACNSLAETIKDVAGVPGRITVVNGYARALMSPQFGASKHTAELLLHAKETWTRIRSCLCVSGRDEVAEKAKKMGFRMVSIEEPESAASKIIKSLISKKQLPGIRTLYPAIHVPGGFGVEPILYLFGPSAKEVSERSLLLSDALKG
ncbi:MAG: thiamine-phosphate synthase family protein [Candidatus Thorarchaeota archaeon]|jgi:predicted fused transcriptional regulator/phosphomethylpyrimidine kinase/predicted transcriptional regulator